MKPQSDWLESLPGNRLLAEMSLWSADLGKLADEIDRVEALTDIFHVDVADGHFSPALLFFPDLVAVCRKKTSKPLHVHLMVSDDILEDQIRQFADSGADLISIHAENGNLSKGLDLIASLGLLSGVVLQLQTPVSHAAGYIDRIGMLTLLGTRIGIKGQGLDPEAEPRLREATKLIADAKLPDRVVLAADGGIRDHTVPGLRRAGAETIVMGSLAFNDPDFPKRMEWVRSQKIEG
jgi:ribulose-phosphate 3-epimerase